MENANDYPDFYLIKSVLFGVAVGDALGVPVEFKSRQEMKKNPVQDMIGFGTYNLPPGTFSDDSSLTFCLAEALIDDFSLERVGQKFIDWRFQNYWTPRGIVFDIGITTRNAINRLAEGVPAEEAGSFEERSNGNGSLMRILPLVFYLKGRDIEERYHITRKISAITHGHHHSVFSCFYYLEFARLLIIMKDKYLVYETLKKDLIDKLSGYLKDIHDYESFGRLLKKDIYQFREEEIFSSGYVIHTLEASIWCLLTTDNYKDAVLKAVNLGDDSDTTAAVTGGLAAILYGFDSIPADWVSQLARSADIEDLTHRLTFSLAKRPK